MSIKKTTAILIAVIMAFTSPVIHAEGEDKQYDLGQLTEMMLNQSQDTKAIDINTALIDVQNENSIKSYNDMKDTVKNQEEYVKGIIDSIKKLDQQTKDAGSPGDQSGYKNQRDNLVGGSGSILRGGGNYIAALQKYQNYVSSYVTLMKSMEPALLQKQQSTKLKSDQVEILKYNFQKDYYNLVTLNRQLEITSTDYDNINGQLEAEKIKSVYGMTTDVNIEDLEQQKLTLEASINEMRNNIDLAKDNMKTKLDIDSANDLDIKYEIPALSESDAKDFSLVILASNFKANNTDLETQALNAKLSKTASDMYNLAYNMKSGIVVNPDPITKEDVAAAKTMELAAQKAVIDETNLKSSMDIYIQNAYFLYNKAKSDFLSSIENRKTYDQKKQIAESNYKQGMISKLQYDMQVQAINKDIFNADKAVLAFINAKKLVEIVNMGIYTR